MSGPGAGPDFRRIIRPYMVRLGCGLEPARHVGWLVTFCHTVTTIRDDIVDLDGKENTDSLQLDMIRSVMRLGHIWKMA